MFSVTCEQTMEFNFSYSFSLFIYLSFSLFIYFFFYLFIVFLRRERQAFARLDKRSCSNSVESHLEKETTRLFLSLSLDTRELRASLGAPRVILLGNNISGFNCTGSNNLSLAPREPRIRAMRRRCFTPSCELSTSAFEHVPGLTMRDKTA